MGLSQYPDIGDRPLERRRSTGAAWAAWAFVTGVVVVCDLVANIAESPDRHSWDFTAAVALGVFIGTAWNGVLRG